MCRPTIRNRCTRSRSRKWCRRHHRRKPCNRRRVTTTAKRSSTNISATIRSTIRLTRALAPLHLRPMDRALPCQFASTASICRKRPATATPSMVCIPATNVSTTGPATAPACAMKKIRCRRARANASAQSHRRHRHHRHHRRHRCLVRTRSSLRYKP